MAVPVRQRIFGLSLFRGKRNGGKTNRFRIGGILQLEGNLVILRAQRKGHKQAGEGRNKFSNHKFFYTNLLLTPSRRPSLILFGNSFRMFFQELFPSALAFGDGDGAGGLEVMTQGDGKGIRGIQVLAFQLDAQRFFQHELHLLLGGGAVAHDGLLGLAGSVLGDIGHAILLGSEDGGPLRAAQFEDHLRIFSVEGALDGQLRGVVIAAHLADAFVNGLEFGVGIRIFPQIQHAHVHVGGLFALYADDAKTQKLGSRVYAKNDAFHKAAQRYDFARGFARD